MVRERRGRSAKCKEGTIFGRREGRCSADLIGKVQQNNHLHACSRSTAKYTRMVVHSLHTIHLVLFLVRPCIHQRLSYEICKPIMNEHHPQSSWRFDQIDQNPWHHRGDRLHRQRLYYLHRHCHHRLLALGAMWGPLDATVQNHLMQTLKANDRKQKVLNQRCQPLF